MSLKSRLVPGALFVLGLGGATQCLFAEEYPLILHGKVMMQDGSVPTKAVSIQRVCSDVQGSAPGPLIDKKGEYQWRMMVDPLRTRACRLEASSEGLQSSSVDISGLNGYNSTTAEIETLILYQKGSNPRAIDSSTQGVPSKASKPFKEAMKAMDAQNFQGMIDHLKEAVEAAPQFAKGWNALGLAYEQVNKYPEAKDAYEHAMAADPKTLAPFVNVEAIYIRSKDWQTALKNANTVISQDSKKMFPVMYMQLAIAQFRTGDLEGAKASVEQAIKLDAGHKMPRTEYILGRILLAKGDVAGAKQHIMHYFELDPTAPDLELLNAHYLKLGTPEAASVDPALERP
jgi:tetratricopeptide (TPR) repeat protein